MILRNLVRGNLMGFGMLMLVAGMSVVPQLCIANDLRTCMSDMILQAPDEMTIGELRLECENQISKGDYSEKGEKESVVSERLQQDEENILKPFTLMAHKPNYLLIAAHNGYGYNPELYRETFDDPSIDFKDTEAQFQLSIKFPLAVNLLNTFDIYAAYTNRSFWQVYNSDISAPFRETNHEPEGWIQFNPMWKFFGFTNTATMFGFVHQSNGRGGALSRSWNRVYANFLAERGNFALSFKPWFRLSEDDEDDDNPDITDYLGHYELRAAYKWKDHVFSLMSRNNLESGFKNGAVELGWSFPLWNYPYLKGYVQYFTGYGESLIDYDQYVNRIGIGLALTDWL